MRTLLIALLLVGTAVAVREYSVVQDTGSGKRLRGRVTDYASAPISQVEINVYDNPQVLDDESLTQDQKRAKQKKIASGMSDERGSFEIKGVPKGRYEVYFDRFGWDALSAIVNVDPHGQNLCPELRISGAAGHGKLKSCR